jgi:hypothetical protein
LRLKRASTSRLVLGGSVAIVLSLADLLVIALKDEWATGAEERRHLITDLLTDADPRAIGIEAKPASSGA